MDLDKGRTYKLSTIIRLWYSHWKFGSKMPEYIGTKNTEETQKPDRRVLAV